LNVGYDTGVSADLHDQYALMAVPGGVGVMLVSQDATAFDGFQHILEADSAFIQQPLILLFVPFDRGWFVHAARTYPMYIECQTADAGTLLRWSGCVLAASMLDEAFR
jgi:hypothetical protein